MGCYSYCSKYHWIRTTKIEEQMAKEVGFDSRQELVESDAAIIPDYWQALHLILREVLEKK